MCQCFLLKLYDLLYQKVVVKTVVHTYFEVE